MKRKHVVTVLACALCLLLARTARPEPTDEEIARIWAAVEQKFVDYFKKLDPGLHYAEVRSARLRKFLPDWRVMVRTDGHLVGRSNLFLLNRNGEVSDLGEAVWTGDPDGKVFQVKRVNEFVKQRAIRVKSADDAVEIAKLIEEIAEAPDYVGFLKINSKDFTLFDKQFIALHGGASPDNANYKYTAVPVEGGWGVIVDYIGPPASIPAPPLYEIDLNKDKEFMDLRRRTH
jgi:hypothetical protein